MKSIKDILFPQKVAPVSILASMEQWGANYKASMVKK